MNHMENTSMQKYLVTLLKLNYFEILPELTFDGRILATYIMLAMLKY